MLNKRRNCDCTIDIRFLNALKFEFWRHEKKSVKVRMGNVICRITCSKEEGNCWEKVHLRTLETLFQKAVPSYSGEPDGYMGDGTIGLPQACYMCATAMQCSCVVQEARCEPTLQWFFFGGLCFH